MLEIPRIIESQYMYYHFHARHTLNVHYCECQNRNLLKLKLDAIALNCLLNWFLNLHLRVSPLLAKSSTK